MTTLKYALFLAAARFLPAAWRARLGGSSVLKPLRDRFFRPGGPAQLAVRKVEFEGWRFRFSASYQALLRAETTGVEARLCRLILAECGAGSVCIDVGANYGFVTLIMGLAVGGRGRVLSFEPAPGLYEALRRNIEDNELREVCQPVQLALSQQEGTTAIAQPGSTFQARCSTLDRYLEEHPLEKLDLIKIDTDGGDFDVLQGAVETLRRFRPVVIVEMAERQQEIYSLLRELGYRHLLDMTGAAVRAGEWPPNLIAACRPVRIPERGSLRKTNAE